MKAQHPGPCQTCGGRIHPGDDIEPSRDTDTIRDEHHGYNRAIPTGWQHATCASVDRGQTSLLDAALIADPTEAGALCPECFTYHRGDCA